MAKQASRKELEKALRASRLVLPGQIGFAVVSLGILWGLHLWLRFESWIAWGLTIFAVFGAVGDGINIVYCRWQLRHDRD